jgi:hypothetical protein
VRTGPPAGSRRRGSEVYPRPTRVSQCSGSIDIRARWSIMMPNCHIPCWVEGARNAVFRPWQLERARAEHERRRFWHLQWGPQVPPQRHGWVVCANLAVAAPTAATSQTSALMCWWTQCARAALPTVVHAPVDSASKLKSRAAALQRTTPLSSTAATRTDQHCTGSERPAAQSAARGPSWNVENACFHWAYPV